MQSIAQLGVGLNLVVLGYAESRLSIEESIENVLDESRNMLDTINRSLDKKILDADGSFPKGNKANSMRGNIMQKWDAIQLSIMLTRINEKFYSVQRRYLKYDSFFQVCMLICAIASTILLFVSSYSSDFFVQNLYLLLLSTVICAPAFIRFTQVIIHTRRYKNLLKPRPRSISSQKLEQRKARINRNYEDEADALAKKLGWSSKTFTVDERYISIEDGGEIGSIYFISGQLRQRIRSLEVN